jgi:hypothetical protein
MHRNRFHYFATVVAVMLLLPACAKKNNSDANGASDSAKTETPSTASSTPGEKLMSDTGRFSVQFPGGFPKATKASQPIQTKLGPLTMITYVTEEAEAACMVAYSDYPDEAFEGADINVLLDSARNGALRNVNGTMEKEEQISINGSPGRSIVFTGKSQGKTIHGRFDYYLVKPRLYQVGYMALAKDKLTEPGTEAYFHSFAVSSGDRDK